MKLFYNVKELLIVDYHKKFVKSLQEAVERRLLSLTDEDIKHEDRNTTTNILFFLEHFSQKEDSNDYYGSLDFDLLRLAIADQFLRSQYLEKKIAGLTDIRNVIERFQNQRRFGRNSVTVQDIGEELIEEQVDEIEESEKYLKWLFDHHILEYLFGETSHPEIMKRSKEIIKFIASEGKLTRDHINMIWDSQVGKHETVRQIIWGVIGELAPEMTLEIVDLLFDKIKQFELKDFNPSLLSLVREITIKGIQLCEDLPESEKKWYGLEIFWSLIQDSTSCPIEINHQAHTHLFEFLHWQLCESQKIIYLMRCIDNIKNDQSVASSLRVIQDLVCNIRYNEEDKEILIECLEDENIIDLVADNLMKYKNNAREKAKEMKLSPSQINSTVFTGKYIYTNEIQSRLDFIRFISKHFMLNTQQLDFIWTQVIENHLTEEELNLGFSWLRDIGQLDMNANSISNEDREYLFKRIESLDFSQINDSGWLTLEFYFRCINWIQNKYFDQPEQKLSFVSTLDLFGLDCIWRVALEAESTTVGEHSVKRLCDIYTNHPSDADPSKISLFREAFIDRIMEFLSDVPSFKPSDVHVDKKLNIKISRIFSLIKIMMERCESSYDIQRHGTNIQGSPLSLTVKFVSGGSFVLNLFANETIRDLKAKIASKVNESPSIIRIIFSGRSFDDDRKTIKECKFQDGQTIHATRRVQAPQLSQPPRSTSDAPVEENKEEKENVRLPSQILSQPNYFDRLFSLLSLPEPLGNLVWDLLMELPTNESLLNQISQFDDNVNWATLLDTENVFKLFYSLQIIESLVKETNDKAQKWSERFKATGGVKHLFRILKDSNFEFNVASDGRRVTCFALLLKIIDLFILKPREENEAPEIIEGLNIEQFNITPRELINKILDIIMNLSYSYKNVNEEKNEEDANSQKSIEQLYIHAMPLLVAYVNSSEENLKYLINYPKIDEWIQFSLLNSPYYHVRETTKVSLYQVSLKSIGLFLEKLLRLLPTVDPYHKTCTQYFELLNELIESFCQLDHHGEPDLIKDATSQIIHLIENHPVIELRGSKNEDNVIIGLMTIATTIARNRQDLKPWIGRDHLIGVVFTDFLFTFASPKNNGPDAPPLCKTQKSRSTAFNFLRELTNQCEENFIALVDRMIQCHGPRKIPLKFWAYQPTGFDKALCGYVGLRNLGATCYMNSLMQQFFMIPQFRANILQIRDAKEDENENILFQLQNIFANLQESEMNYFDTTPFCDVYKCYGEPMNPRIQMDVDEFFSMLFDKLERTIKGTNKENVLKEFFGGVLTNQIASLECGHTSERNEDFFTLSVDVKNKKRLEDSLELYVQGDLLEGQNKYSCGQCGNKVDARKRCFIKETPNNLIIHLKRFDFDLELLKRSKINDYCEFPMVLNIEPYTKEGIELREKNLQMDEERLKEFEYDLTGIIVHIGTAESGHYYSFIKERNTTGDPNHEEKWFCFNDKTVEPFDPSEIPEQCYGGFDLNSIDPMYPKKARRLKTYSAYMLFYTKRIPNNDKVQSKITRDELASSVPQELYERTWEENMIFLSDKYFFDPDYLQFAYDIVNKTSSVSESEESLFKGVELGTKFFAETLSHAKEKQLLQPLMTVLYSFYRTNLSVSRWLINHLINDTRWIESILFTCTHFETKKSFANLIFSAMKTIYRDERELINRIINRKTKEILLDDEGEVIMSNNGIDATLPSFTSSQSNEPSQTSSLLIRFLITCSSLIHKASGNEQYYSQFFFLFKAFTSLGYEMRSFMIKNGYLSSFINYYLSLKSLSAEDVKKTEETALENMRELLNAVADLICSYNFNKDTPLKNMLTDPNHIIEIDEHEQDLITSKEFIQRLIHDCIHIESIRRIFLLYCWNDVDMSFIVIQEIIESFQSLEYETYQNVQKIAMSVLRIEDDLQESRLETFLTAYLQVIKANLKHYKETRELARFLISLSDEFVFARDYLFNNMSYWIDKLILYTNDYFVRCITERVVQNLLPWLQPYDCGLQSYLSDKDDIEREDRRINMIPVINDDQADEIEERSNQVFHSLINILPECGGALAKCNKPRPKERLGKVQSVAYSYFRLLNWIMRTEKQAKEFEPYFMFFMEIYHRCDRELFELDFNKLEMIKFLNFLADSKESYLLKIMHGGTEPTDQFLDFFISLNSNNEYLEYNNETCSYYYRFLNKCISLEGEHQQLSKKYLEKIVKHRTWNWGTQYLLLETDKYPQVALELSEIIRQLTIHYKHSDMVRSNIEHVLNCIERLPMKKLYESPDNAMHILDILVQDSLQEKLYCVSKRGVEIICKLVIHVIDKKGMEAYDSIELILKTLCKLLDWVEEVNSDDEDIMVYDQDSTDVDQLMNKAKNALISHYEDTYLMIEKLHTFVGEMTDHVENFLDLNAVVTRRLTKFKMDVTSISSGELSEDD